jgi:hypothetical protein
LRESQKNFKIQVSTVLLILTDSIKTRLHVCNKNYMVTFVAIDVLSSLCCNSYLLSATSLSCTHACKENRQYYTRREQETHAHILMRKPDKERNEGFSAGFFQKAWPIIGEDVCSAIQEFFQFGKLLKESNSTILTLVPKKKNPSFMGDFRPIACCNIVYKCITKILANRMLPGLNDVISLNQGAFIPGRSIAENILLAQEVVCDYHKQKGIPRCALKVDLMKAYDSLNWEYILHCLKCLGAPARFISWIRECITSPSFTIALNGSLVGYFHGKKGLRQGDPISPYLFVIAMEGLSLLLGDAVSSNSQFDFHPRCRELKLNHLCFADDLLIFSAASIRSVKVIKDVLDYFEQLSGLKANPSKSSIFLAGVNPVLKQDILEMLHMPEGVLPVRYLGVPLISKRLTSVDCESLVAKITARIDSWLVRKLSFAGRLQLLSSVLVSL